MKEEHRVWNWSFKCYRVWNWSFKCWEGFNDDFPHVVRMRRKIVFGTGVSNVGKDSMTIFLMFYVCKEIHYCWSWICVHVLENLLGPRGPPPHTLTHLESECLLINGKMRTVTLNEGPIWDHSWVCLWRGKRISMPNMDPFGVRVSFN